MCSIHTYPQPIRMLRLNRKKKACTEIIGIKKQSEVNWKEGGESAEERKGQWGKETNKKV